MRASKNRIVRLIRTDHNSYKSESNGVVTFYNMPTNLLLSSILSCIILSLAGGMYAPPTREKNGIL